MKHQAVVRDSMFVHEHEIEMQKQTSDWNGSDVSNFFAKLEYLLHAFGTTPFPKRLEHLGPGLRMNAHDADAIAAAIVTVLKRLLRNATPRSRI